jgi:cytosine/adenosine deaminase-related metal-dependent hydrolase
MTEYSPISERPQIHRAEWVVPVSSAPLPNGAVMTHAGRVVDVGLFPDVWSASPAGALLIDHGEAALFPVLVNSHTHLEFTGLRGIIPFPQPGFREWIELLIEIRLSAGIEYQTHSIEEVPVVGEAEIISSGTGLYADTTNYGVDAASKTEAFPERQIFLELLGFNLHSISAAMPRQPISKGHGTSAGLAIPVPHSVYSVSPAIIAECKAWTRARGLPFSIHVAEHLDEIEFLRSAQGFCRELIERFERWEPSWAAPGKTPIEYLESLGTLDSHTLLVHAVHMTEADWTLAAKRKCNVVFCPRSNMNMSSGRPWIEKALSLSLNCALATDSLASNTDLNLFAEARFVLDEHPSIDPRRVLEMITVNPARALGRQSDYGSIEPGRKAQMLAVRIGPGVSESDLPQALIEAGKEGSWEWVNCVPS